MNQPIPDWVSKEFFNQCLQKEEKNPDIEVTNFTVSQAAPPGNNYGSFIIRVRLEYKDGLGHHFLSVIVKAELIEGPFKDVICEFNETEPMFYNSFIPKAKNFTNIWFVPSNLYSPEPNVTVLEDLKDKGFVMVDRTKQLDFDHCRLYMMASASLHAVSVAVYKQHPELAEPIKNEIMFSDNTKSKNMFQPMIIGAVICLVEVMEEQDQFKNHINTLNEAIPHLWDMLVEAHRPSEVVNTIRQGDPWATNMMFKYDEEGAVSDIKLLDFQATQYGSPINDLMFFIWSSANNDVKQNRLDELYRVYLDTFNEKLKQFHCSERLTYQQLKENVKKLSPLAISCAALSPAVTDPEPADFSTFLTSDDVLCGAKKYYKKYYNENYCTNYLPHLLKSLEINGVFEQLKQFQK